MDIDTDAWLSPRRVAVVERMAARGLEALVVVDDMFDADLLVTVRPVDQRLAAA